MNTKVALLLMSHGNFAKELLKSAELIVGKQENYETLGVHLDDQIDHLREQMYEKVDSLDTTQGLVVLTDISGGTPMNMAGLLLERSNVLVCSGTNLPMLIELLFNREKQIEEIKEILKSAYMEGLVLRTKNDLESEADENDLLL